MIRFVVDGPGALARSRAVEGRFIGLALVTGFWLLGCGDGDGPSGPPPAPTIGSVTPSQVRPGEQVTIAGDSFGTSAAAVSVTFNGTPGAIVSVTNTSIVATVPAIPAGSATIVVTVGGRASSGVSLTVLRGLPVITGVNPASARQGGTITITGQNLTAARRLAPAGAALEVLLDGDALTPESVTATQVVVVIPVATAVGDHELQLRLGEELSNAVTLPVQILTVTGAYDLMGIVTFNDCPPEIFEFGVGDEVFSFSSVNDGLPTVTISLTSDPDFEGTVHSGTLMPDGTYQVTFVVPGVSSTLEGAFEVGPDEIPVMSGTNTITFVDPSCHVEVEFEAVRVSTTPLARRPGAAVAPASAGPGVGMYGERPLVR